MTKISAGALFTLELDADELGVVLKGQSSFMHIVALFIFLLIISCLI